MYKKNLDTWEKGAHVGSARGNPLACATTAATIDYTQKKGIVEHVYYLGKYTTKQLEERLGDNKFVGEIRGRGLLIAVEFVLDKGTKKAWNQNDRKTLGQII